MWRSRERKPAEIGTGRIIYQWPTIQECLLHVSRESKQATRGEEQGKAINTRKAVSLIDLNLFYFNCEIELYKAKNVT